jgi:hypothetical protein
VLLKAVFSVRVNDFIINTLDLKYPGH